MRSELFINDEGNRMAEGFYWELKQKISSHQLFPDGRDRKMFNTKAFVSVRFF